MATNNAGNNPTGASGTILQGQGIGTASSFSTATYPSSSTINQLLYSSAANVVGGLATANNAILATNSSGVPSLTTASGNWLNTSRTAFFAYPNGLISSVTGDGTSYTIIFNTTRFDQGSNFNTTSGTFTAPVTGVYSIQVGVGLSGIGVGHTSMFWEFIYSSPATILGVEMNPAVSSDGGIYCSTGSQTILMTANATLNILVKVSNSTKTVNVLGGNLGGTWVSGFLVC